MEKEANSNIADLSLLQAEAALPGRYEVISLIGSGGMGRVFQAFDSVLGRDVAVKLLLFEGTGNPESQQRFLREGQALAVLDHPNIVRVYSSGLNMVGNPFHVMEFLQGESLASELKSRSEAALSLRTPNMGMDATVFFEMFDQILAGLDHAHAQGIAHRDLKPSNIMHVKDADNSDLYKIIDFGIARIFQVEDPNNAKTLTRTDALLGSPLYMSPEQCRGERGDHLSDIYSTACIMYECISGSPPLKGETTFETMYKHMTEKPAPLSGKSNSLLSQRLSELVDRCLEIKPEQRPASVAEVRAELDSIHAALLEESSGNGIDIFKKQRAKAKMASVYPAIILAAASLITILFVIISVQKATESNRKEVVLTAESKSKILRAKLESEIVTLQKKLSEVNPETIREPAFKDKYFQSYFELARKQMDPLIPGGMAQAEKTYEKALRFCEKANPTPARLIYCRAMLAKSKWLQGKNAEAEKEFEIGRSLIAQLKEDEEVLIDFYHETARYYVSRRDFKRAEADSKICGETWLKIVREGPDVLPKLVFLPQKFDKKGPNRLDTLYDIYLELQKLGKPRNFDEAIHMLGMSNRLTLSFDDGREVFDNRKIQNAAAFSKKLYDSINPKDKIPTNIQQDSASVLEILSRK